LTIEDCISYFNECFVTLAGLQRETMLYVIRYSHVLSLVNAAASNDDVKHYLLCSNATAM